MNEIAVIPKSKDREEGVESCIPFTDLELGVNVLSALRPSFFSCYCWELRFPLVLQNTSRCKNFQAFAGSGTVDPPPVSMLEILSGITETLSFLSFYARLIVLF